MSLHLDPSPRCSAGLSRVVSCLPLMPSPFQPSLSPSSPCSRNSLVCWPLTPAQFSPRAVTASLGTTAGQRVSRFSPEGRVQGGPHAWEQLPGQRRAALGPGTPQPSKRWGGALTGEDAEPAGVAKATCWRGGEATQALWVSGPSWSCIAAPSLRHHDPRLPSARVAVCLGEWGWR